MKTSIESVRTALTTLSGRRGKALHARKNTRVLAKGEGIGNGEVPKECAHFDVIAHKDYGRSLRAFHGKNTGLVELGDGLLWRCTAKMANKG
jgi:hypothetical protein